MKVSTPWIGVGLIPLAMMLSGSVALSSEYYPFFHGVRADGMGGAAAAVVDDETALFLNPAGLGKLRGPYLTPLNLQIESNFETQSLLLSNSGDLNFATNPQGLLNAAQKAPDQHLHAEAQTMPAFVTTNFGIALYDRYSSDSMLTSATNTYHLDYFNDVGATIGYSFRLFDGILKIGVAGKVIDRTYVSQDFSSTTTNLSLSSIASEGTGVGWDGSAMLTLPWRYLPTLTAVFHDVGGTKFTLNNGYFYKTGTTPPVQPQEVDVAAALFPIVGKHTRTSFTVEIQNLANLCTADPLWNFHAGAEINFGDVFFIRGGLNEHYWTAGLEFDILHNQIQLASYGEDIVIFGGCGNIFTSVSPQNTDAALFDTATNQVDGSQWTLAIATLNEMSAAALATTEAQDLLAAAYAGRGGLNLLNLIQDLGNIGSTTLFTELLKIYDGSGQSQFSDEVTAEGIIQNIGPLAANRSLNENTLMVGIELAKLGTLIAARADPNDTGVYSASFNSCRTITPSDATQVVTAIGNLIDSFSSVSASIPGLSLGAIATDCATLGTLCTVTTASAVTANEIRLARTLVGETNLQIGLAVASQTGYCELSPPVVGTCQGAADTLCP
ncbi:unnamed protein product [Sphagnum balticum]